jgi:hypothetical protein
MALVKEYSWLLGFASGIAAQLKLGSEFTHVRQIEESLGDFKIERSDSL